jgi:hypothetical protein
MSLDRIVSRSLDRRTFLRAASRAAPTILVAERIAADPYGPAVLSPTRIAPPVRVRGLLRGNGRGIPRVAVSDGLDVVATDASGRFELVTSADRDFVHVTVPAGWRVPTNPTGTARFYSPIALDQTEMDMVFELDPLDRTDERHTLILLGDIQTEDAGEMQGFHQQSVPDIRATVAALGDQEVFRIACGDIMFDNLGLYPDYERGVHDMGVPFFQVVGNHDLDQGGATDVLSTRTFQSHFGPRHYSFERGAVHYVVLDDGSGTAADISATWTPTCSGGSSATSRWLSRGAR